MKTTNILAALTVGALVGAALAGAAISYHQKQYPTVGLRHSSLPTLVGYPMPKLPVGIAWSEPSRSEPHVAVSNRDASPSEPHGVEQATNE
jgi:hypothetical protein